MLSAVAVVQVTQRRPAGSLLLASPLLLALLLALAGVYPWRDRVAMFSVWPFFIFAPLGLQVLRYRFKSTMVRYATKTVAVLLAVPPLLIMLYAFGAAPVRFQPSEPVLREVKNSLKPGDEIYVYYKARHAMSYYGPKAGIDDWVSGNYYEKAAGYRKDIEKLKGEPRVWFFYTQWTGAEPFPDSIRVYLGNAGKELIEIKKPAGGSGQEISAAYLYDLSSGPD